MITFQEFENGLDINWTLDYKTMNEVCKIRFSCYIKGSIYAELPREAKDELERILKENLYQYLVAIK